jgi:hypothetical protein
MNTKFINTKWSNLYLPISNGLFLSKLLIKNTLNKLWNKDLQELLDGGDIQKHILLLFRIQLTNGEFSTLGKLQRLNYKDKSHLIEYLTALLELHTEEYNNRPIKAIILSYGIRDGIINNDFNKEIHLAKSQVYFHFKIPITMDPFKFGHVIKQMNNIFILQTASNNVAMIEQTSIEDTGVISEINKVKIFKNGKIALEFIDTKIDEKTFIRDIGERKYHFVDEKLTLLTVKKSGKFISAIDNKKKKSAALTKVNKDKILTLDIETKVVNDQHIPYTISIFLGSVGTQKKQTLGNLFSSFYLSDFRSDNTFNHKDMLKTAIKTILKRKFKNYHVYVHNFANFDAIFLLNILVELAYEMNGGIKPIIHKGKIISISLYFSIAKSQKYVIHFKDSFQILPNSLKLLCESFDVSTKKSIFPYAFVNADNVSLDYIGEIPKYNFFSNITVDEYTNYCNNIIMPWSLRDEIIKYCNIDVQSLYEVLFKFNNLIYNLFELNVNDYPTLPSLAFAIFKKKFMNEKSIMQMSGKIFKDIKKSYTGGAVDLYLPTNNEFDLIYVYDYNSLYPFTMDNFEMPVGIPTYFEGDIRKKDPNAFGFFYCKIKTPKDLKYPILQTHVHTKNGIRTMAALGQYEDMLFSKEMDNAIQFGYEFEILWGYTFDRSNIFSGFIQFLYNLRLKYPKGSALNLIAKLIMNSLYGRMGMDDSFSNFVIIDKKDYEKWEQRNIDSIIDITSLDGKYLVEVKPEYQDLNTMLDHKSETHNINIAIASAITAYARIHMSQTIKFLIDNGYILYYKDTDSLFINKPLPDNMVSKTELGKLKLEYICKKGIFLAPKVYCLLTIDDKIICKIKGLSNKQINLSTAFEDFESLLKKDSKLEKSHEKWFKDLDKGLITVKQQLYTLKVTSNKRDLIYDKDGVFIDTKPYFIDNNKSLKQINNSVCR